MIINSDCYELIVRMGECIARYRQGADGIDECPVPEDTDAFMKAFRATRTRAPNLSEKYITILAQMARCYICILSSYPQYAECRPYTVDEELSRSIYLLKDLEERRD